MSHALTQFPIAKLPPRFVVSLAGTCCTCAETGAASPCGACGEHGVTPACDCTRLNGYFELEQDKSNPGRYVLANPGTAEGSPQASNCSAQALELCLHDSDLPGYVNVCLALLFADGSSLKPVSWGKVRIADPRKLVVLRRRSTNPQCCWPKEVVLNPIPVPDLCAPPPHWQPGDADDLNGGPYVYSLIIEYEALALTRVCHLARYGCDFWTCENSWARM